MFFYLYRGISIDSFIKTNINSGVEDLVKSICPKHNKSTNGSASDTPQAKSLSLQRSPENQQSTYAPWTKPVLAFDYVEQQGSLLFLCFAVWLSAEGFVILTVPFVPFCMCAKCSGERGSIVLDFFSFSLFFTPSYMWVTRSSNASVTLVESSADVSINSMPWSAAYWRPRFVSTIRRCLRSDLLPTMITDKFGSVCCVSSEIHLSRF